MRIDGPFYGGHHIGTRAVFQFEITPLALSDPVFSRAGALHGKRAHVQPLDHVLGPCDLILVIHHDERRHVKIAVTDVPYDRRDEIAFLAILHRFGNAPPILALAY